MSNNISSNNAETTKFVVAQHFVSGKMGIFGDWVSASDFDTRLSAEALSQYYDDNEYHNYRTIGEFETVDEAEATFKKITDVGGIQGSTCWWRDWLEGLPGNHGGYEFEIERIILDQYNYINGELDNIDPLSSFISPFPKSRITERFFLTTYSTVDTFDDCIVDDNEKDPRKSWFESEWADLDGEELEERGKSAIQVSQLFFTLDEARAAFAEYPKKKATERGGDAYELHIAFIKHVWVDQFNHPDKTEYDAIFVSPLP